MRPSRTILRPASGMEVSWPVAGSAHALASPSMLARGSDRTYATGRRYPMWFADATYPCDVIRREHSPPDSVITHTHR